MKNRYLVIENWMGSTTDMGFANTWRIISFPSQSWREKYVDVEENRNQTVKKITVKDARKKFYSEWKDRQCIEHIEGCFRALTDTEVKEGFCPR